MKKMIYIVALIVLFAGMSSFASVITERKIQPRNTAPYNTNKQKPVVVPRKKNPISDNLLMCKPYTETMKSDYLGMNVDYKVSILGWVNDKCILDFIAQTNGTSSSFLGLYGINPDEAIVTSFAPKIRCEFTRRQLEYVGDSILQEQERNAGASNNMLKDPNSIKLPNLLNLSSDEAKLFEVVLGSNACQIQNGGNLNNMIQDLMGF